MISYFRDTVKRAIKERGRRNDWLAEQLGISRTQLSRMLNGHSDGRFEQWQKLFDLLGVKVYLTLEDERPDTELWRDLRAAVYQLWSAEQITTSRAREMLGFKSIQEVRALFAEMDAQK